MAQSPVSIVSPHFCAPHPIDLNFGRKLLKITDGNFVVNDVNGNLMFDVKGSLLNGFHDRRVILNVAGRPIITLRRKILSAHSRWQAFRGESTEEKGLIFSAKTSSMIPFNPKLHVFLAKNTSEDVCDYAVKGSWFESSCTVYAGDSSTIVAQMQKKFSAENILIGKDKFMVTVYPNIDYAFIVALIVILDEINSSDD